MRRSSWSPSSWRRDNLGEAVHTLSRCRGRQHQKQWLPESLQWGPSAGCGPVDPLPTSASDPMDGSCGDLRSSSVISRHMVEAEPRRTCSVHTPSMEESIVLVIPDGVYRPDVWTVELLEGLRHHLSDRVSAPICIAEVGV